MDVVKLEVDYHKPDQRAEGKLADGSVALISAWVQAVKSLDLMKDDADAVRGPKILVNTKMEIRPAGEILVCRAQQIHSFPNIPGKRTFYTYRHLLMRVREGCKVGPIFIDSASWLFRGAELILAEGTDWKTPEAETAKFEIIRKFPMRAERITKSSVLLFALYLSEHGLLNGHAPSAVTAAAPSPLSEEPRRKIALP